MVFAGAVGRVGAAIAGTGARAGAPQSPELLGMTFGCWSAPSDVTWKLRLQTTLLVLVKTKR